MVYIPPEFIWMVVVGFIIAFALAMSIGANDIANSFGTSVGAKALTLTQACIIASICETLGAILLGGRVTDTIRKGIIDITMFENNTGLLLVGDISALTGSCVWLIIATVFKMPVSGTHSVVGATVGFALVAHGARGIMWTELGFIVLSWFVSPVLSGIVSVGLFVLIKYAILNRHDRLEPGLRFLPGLYACIIFINVFSIFYKGPELLHFNEIPLWGVFVLSFGSSVIVVIVVQFALVPWQRRRIHLKCEAQSLHLVPAPVPYSESINDLRDRHFKAADKTMFLNITKRLAVHNEEKLKSEGKPNEEIAELTREMIEDKCEHYHLFSYLQIVTAIFGSFAHGGNDVSNAIGPVVGIWTAATNPTVQLAAQQPAPIWLLLCGGVGISIGLWIWGRRVIQTMGEDLAKITPSIGFCIELGSAMTVLVASNLTLPISTTHCKVGSVVFVGWVRSRRNVDWKLFLGILLAWVLTLPVAGGVSAGVMALLMMTVRR